MKKIINIKDIDDFKNHPFLVEKNLNFDSVEKILTENKGNQREQISFNKDRIVQALSFNIVKRDKRYIEAYIINAIKEYKNNKFNIHNSNFD